MNLAHLPDNIQADLYRRCIDSDFDGNRLNAEQVEQIQHKCQHDSAEDLFDEWCNWHGLIGWASTLIETIDALRDAEAESQPQCHSSDDKVFD